jgi:hypothetical protein
MMAADKDKEFLAQVAKLHPESDTVGDLEASKKKFPKLYKSVQDGTATPGNWLDSFRAKYGQFARILDGAEGEAEARQVFGNDLIDLILDVAKNPKQYDFTTQAGLEYFDSKVYATEYYNNTAVAAKNFDAKTRGQQIEEVATSRGEIAANYGDLSLTNTELDSIAKVSARRGLKGTALTNYVNSIVGERARGRTDLLESMDAVALKKVANAYGYNPADLEDQIFAGIQGKAYNGEVITADTIKKKGIALAKAAYFGLSDQLDAGLTLQEIFQPYRDLAARTLELAPDAVDFMDTKFSAAFGSKDKGPMSMGEFQDLLKSDPKYGYDKTKQAKNDARSMVMAMAQAFGKVQ